MLQVGTTTRVVCNGAAGARGADGAPGTPGTSVTIAAAPVAQCPFGGTAVTAGTVTRYVCNGAPGTTPAVNYDCPDLMTRIPFEDARQILCVAELGDPETKFEYTAVADLCATRFGGELCTYGQFIQLCSKSVPIRPSSWFGGFTGTSALGFPSGLRDEPCNLTPFSIPTENQLNYAYCCRSIDVPR